MRSTVTTTVLLASLMSATLLLGPLPLAFAQDEELVGKPPEEEAPPSRGPTRLDQSPVVEPTRPEVKDGTKEEPEEKPVAQMDAIEREARYKALTQEASLAFENGDLDHAIEAFEKAYAIKPVANILYNLGRIHESNGDIAEAIANYQSFVTTPGIDQGPREDALARIRALKEVQALKEEEAIESQAQAPKAEQPPAAEVIEGPAPKVEQPAPTPQAEAPRVVMRSEAPRAEPADYTLSYTLLGTSGVTLIGAGVFALLASDANTEAEDATTLQARRDAADSGETHALIADGLLVTGLVTGAIGGLSWWWVSERADDARALRVGPQLGVDRVGVRVRWDY